MQDEYPTCFNEKHVAQLGTITKKFCAQPKKNNDSRTKGQQKMKALEDHAKKYVMSVIVRMYYVSIYVYTIHISVHIICACVHIRVVG